MHHRTVALTLLLSVVPVWTKEKKSSEAIHIDTSAFTKSSDYFSFSTEDEDKSSSDSSSVLLSYEDRNKIEPKNQKDLVHKLLSYGFLNDTRVAKAMEQVDLEKYEGCYIEVGQQLYSGNAHMYSCILWFLRDHLKEGNKALDVEIGSGYLTVCMGLMVGKKGVVVGIENTDDDIRWSTRYIRRYNPSVIKGGQVKLVVCNCTGGYPEMAPYDAMYVGAYADSDPEVFLKQLNVGGRLLIPRLDIKSRYLVAIYDKDMQGKVTREEVDMFEIQIPVATE